MTTTRRRYVVGALAVIVVGMLAYAALRPRPVKLMITPRAGDDTIVVNQRRLTPLGAFLLDQYGRRIRGGSLIRYRWKGGDSLRLSPTGDVRCTDRRDALVRASVGRLERDFVVRCRPVAWIEAASWLDLLAGDSTRDLSFVAHGPDGRAVTELRGSVIVSNGSLISARGTTIRPKQPGFTMATIQIGDVETNVPILIYQPVATFANLSRGNDLLAMRISLARGDTLEVPLPRAAFWVTYFSKDSQVPPPTIELKGDGSCTLGNGLRQRRIEEGEYAKYCLTGTGARMMIAHGNQGIERVTGVVAIRLM